MTRTRATALAIGNEDKAVLTQLTFLPDNDHERVVKRPAVPVAKLIAGHWCWLVSGTQEYQHEPALEHLLLAALARREAA